MKTFASFFTTAKVNEWGTFPKCGAGLGSWLVLGSLFPECTPNLGLMALGGPQIMEGLPLGPFPYSYIAYILESTITLFGVVSNKCYMLQHLQRCSVCGPKE